MRLYKTRRKEKMKMKKLAVLFAAAALTTVPADRRKQPQRQPRRLRQRPLLRQQQRQRRKQRRQQKRPQKQLPRRTRRITIPGMHLRIIPGIRMRSVKMNFW